MEKLRSFLDSRAEPRAETVLERAVREELKRLDLMKAVCSSHRTSGTAAVPIEAPKKPMH